MTRRTSGQVSAFDALPGSGAERGDPAPPRQLRDGPSPKSMWGREGGMVDKAVDSQGLSPDRDPARETDAPSRGHGMAPGFIGDGADVSRRPPEGAGRIEGNGNLGIEPGEGAETSDGRRSRRRERAALDALRSLVRDHYVNRFGLRGLKADRDILLSLRFRIRPGRSWETDFDPGFAAQADEQLSDERPDAETYRNGRVYCFRCESVSCAHGTPPTPTSVFKGYASTGVPEWHELYQALVEARDERVDRLFRDPPSVLARVQLGSELKSRQLSSFGKGSRTYALLGQVVSGHFPMTGPPAAGGRRPCVAVTFQAVQTRDVDGRIALRLNVLPGNLDPQRWEELLLSDWQPALYRAWRRSVETVNKLDTGLRSVSVEGGECLRRILQQVPGVLRSLARDIERGGRQRERRTRHAEARQPDRPIHKAVDDARAVGGDALFYDERNETWVVLGAQRRTHVFSSEGRHVTSFKLPPGGEASRVRRGRWRKASADEVSAFRSMLDRMRASSP